MQDLFSDVEYEVQSVSQIVKISPRMSQKRLRFGNNVGACNFMKFAKEYHQQQEEECASVGRMIVHAMSPPRLADIGVLLQEAEATCHTVHSCMTGP